MLGETRRRDQGGSMGNPIRIDHPIIGTWRLTSFTNQDTETGAVTYPLGEQPSAIVIYSADGYAATIFTSADRKPPVAAQASDEEAIELYRSMIAFAGRYHLDGPRLTYNPEISWNQTWNGTTQERLFEIRGDRLHVRSLPSINPLTGARTVFSLVWERAR
jgi:Lipocalin-like domain